MIHREKAPFILTNFKTRKNYLKIILIEHWNCERLRCKSVSWTMSYPMMKHFFVWTVLCQYWSDSNPHGCNMLVKNHLVGLFFIEGTRTLKVRLLWQICWSSPQTWWALNRLVVKKWLSGRQYHPTWIHLFFPIDYLKSRLYTNKPTNLNNRSRILFQAYRIECIISKKSMVNTLLFWLYFWYHFYWCTECIKKLYFYVFTSILKGENNKFSVVCHTTYTTKNAKINIILQQKMVIYVD